MPHTGPILEGRGDSDYERYVRVPELLELQKPVEQLSHPEERLFQTTHQAAELWLHHVDYEIGRVVAHLGADEVAPAANLMHRCRLIIDLLRETCREENVTLVIVTHTPEVSRQFERVEKLESFTAAMADGVVLRRLAPAEDAGLERLFFELTTTSTDIPSTPTDSIHPELAGATA